MLVQYPMARCFVHSCPRLRLSGWTGEGVLVQHFVVVWRVQRCLFTFDIRDHEGLSKVSEGR
jgi:hypothetical protein